MALPEGFAWQGVHLNDRSAPRVLALHGEGVVRLEDRVDDGSWFAMLDYHHGMARRTPTRPCTSFEAGKRGAELWAIRHEARLRAEVAEKIANRPRHNGAGGRELPGKG
ncbi:hypothetical protein EA661_13080 [Pseudoxanthomonas winnipegensis]|uniref:Uncharacterized protein n=1 Tax=Pseudoxanthomonas winnipegensis TaxID=2480810 RepID=A0A4Q8LET3_9GAMM|nr:hypothetical protein [Pseudoxanthomonas winnipegensis]TAA27681.1 hypothetical protein EA661_13080 [Pseudoxanthomonas winnipegensis]